MTSIQNLNVSNLRTLQRRPAGLNIAIPILQTSRPTALEGESKVKNKVMKRTKWLMGASLIALALSGCLEGGRAQYGQDDPGVQQVSSTADLLPASEALHAFFYPAGTKLTYATGSPVQIDLIYPKTIQVATENELEAALLVPAGDQPHNVVLKNTIVVDRPLTVQGDVQIIGSLGLQSIETLRFVDKGAFNITNNAKPAPRISQMRACLSSAWQRLAYGSSLRLAVMTDGEVRIGGTADMFHLVLTSASGGGTFMFENSALRKLVVFDPGSSDSTVLHHATGLSASDFVVSNSTFIFSKSDFRDVLDSHRLIISPRPDIVSSSYCQNLAANYQYPMNDYYAVSQRCRDGRWDDLAISFNNCGVAQ